MARIKIGDIIEIKTKKGLTYAQYTHKNKLMGSLIRVFINNYNTRPEVFDNIIEDEVRFILFFPLQQAVNQKIVEIVGNVGIPEKAKKFPVFKNGIVNPETNIVDVWWLWDGEKSEKIGHLNNKQLLYPTKSIWNDTLLIERIEEEWKPKDSF